MKEVNGVTHSSDGDDPAIREETIDETTAKSSNVEEKDPSGEKPVGEDRRMEDDKEQGPSRQRNEIPREVSQRNFAPAGYKNVGDLEAGKETLHVGENGERCPRSMVHEESLARERCQYQNGNRRAA